MKLLNDSTDINYIAPKIWSNKFNDSDYTANGDCDCDCACPTQDTDFKLFEQDLHLSFFENTIFQKASSVYQVELSQEHYLVCNTLEGGYISILNPIANLILNFFQTPNTLNEIYESLVYIPKDIIRETMIQLQNLELIRNLFPSKPLVKPSELKILSAWIHVTNDCNLLCPYCYLNKTHDDMSSDTAVQTINAIFRSAKINNYEKVNLKFAGGEASLNFSHIISIYDYAKSLSLKSDILLDAIILSNGVAISNKMIDELIKREIRIMISLDGVNEYHDAQRIFINGKGSFQYVNRSINRLIDRGLIPNISVTVSDRNLEGLPQLIKYIIDRDLPFSLNYYRENDCSTTVEGLRFREGRMIEVMRMVFATIERNLPRRSLLGGLVDRANLRVLHEHTCGVGRNYLVIDQNGGVAKCQMDIANPITNINSEDILKVIQKDVKGIQNLPVDQKEGCQSCEWRYWCAGGCPMLTHRATGRYDVKSPNCNIYKSLYPEALRLEALRLLNYSQPWLPVNNY